MVESNEVVDNNQSLRIGQKLEGQIDEIMELFDFAEKLYPYENIRGESAELNEDKRRK